jgi:protease IV
MTEIFTQTIPDPHNNSNTTNSAGDKTQNQWAERTLETLARDLLVEQRRARRWKIFFRFAILTYFTLFLIGLFGIGSHHGGKETSGKHTAVVELSGVIDLNGGASAEKIMGALKSAFEDSNTQGVILRINSPGGSPVQSAMIFDGIKSLRKKYPNIPLYAVVEEMCASGGYYVAAAADQIYVNPASLVGSIGVLMDGFGFTGTMEKLGVERRLVTAGENKGMLDPFSPRNEKHQVHIQNMLNDVHQQFIEAVKLGRGKRLKETPEMFSGLIWTGNQSIQLGLADAVGSVGSVARDIIKAETIVDFTEHDNFAERFARKFGSQIGFGFSSGVTSGLGSNLR